MISFFHDCAQEILCNTPHVVKTMLGRVNKNLSGEQQFKKKKKKSDIVTVIYILFSVIAPSLNPRHCFLLLWLLQCRVYQCTTLLTQ